jgi:hypothetical protein
VLDAVRAGLAAIGPLDERDRAVAELAKMYADVLDADLLGESLPELGPKLLAALTALQLTPAARAAAVKGAERKPGGPPSPMDELRRKRAERRAP